MRSVSRKIPAQGWCSRKMVVQQNGRRSRGNKCHQARELRSTVLVDQCYLAACACGDSLAQIPYANVWNLLSKSGQNLLLGAY